MLKQFLSTSAVSVMGIGLMLVVNVLFARMLGVEQFGLYSLAMTAAVFLAVPVCGGLPLLLTREIASARHDNDDERQNMVSTAALFWAVAASFAVIAVAVPVARSFDTPSSMVIGLAALALPAMGLAAVGKGVLKGLSQPALAEVPGRLGLPIVLISGALFLWYSGTATAESTVALHICAHFVVALLSVWLAASASPVKPRLLRSGRANLSRWGQDLVSFTLISSVGTLGVQLAILVLGAFGEPDQIAYLRVAERGAQLVSFPLLFINSILGPHIVRAIRDGRSGEMHQLSRKAARMTTAVSAPIALVLILFGKPLIGITFGPAYVDAAYGPLVILSVGQLLSVMVGSVGMMLIMSGHERLNLLLQVAGIGVLVLALFLLVGPYQAIGGAVAMALGLLTINLLVAIAVYRKLGFVPGVF